MGDNDILTALKVDLQISSNSYDAYLKNILELAKAAIAREGITIAETVEDGMLIEMYAAYLYRKRRGENAAMPRSLRYALNNRLMSQKAGGENG